MSTPGESKESVVTVTITVDGKEYLTSTGMVEPWAIAHVVQCMIAQLEDPDYEGARDHEENG